MKMSDVMREGVRRVMSEGVRRVMSEGVRRVMSEGVKVQISLCHQHSCGGALLKLGSCHTLVRIFTV